MAKEIERKFLVTDTSYKALAVKVMNIAQGYLNRDPDRTVRVRVSDGKAWLTVKTRTESFTRNEWEYEIPLDDGRQMLEACSGVIEKIRYIVPASDGLKWEVDEFRGAHSGLVVAEIELPSEDACFELPAFAGQEVTGDARYYNSNL